MHGKGKPITPQIVTGAEWWVGVGEVLQDGYMTDWYNPCYYAAGSHPTQLGIVFPIMEAHNLGPLSANYHRPEGGCTTTIGRDKSLQQI